jgi:CHAT domain-containing protein
LAPSLGLFDLECAAKLYDILVRPIECLAAPYAELVVIPDGCLTRLPFEALVAEKRDSCVKTGKRPEFLVERFEITYGLAASLLLGKNAEGRQPSKVLMAFGNPSVPPSIPEALGHPNVQGPGPVLQRMVSLPGAQRELDRIQNLFGNSAKIMLREDATKANFKREASTYRIIHIAGHATYDEVWPMNSGIELASGGDDPDGNLLRAFEFLNMDLNADLVFLSGCNTGRSKENGDANGLVRALYFAGVPSVISTLWGVEDESAEKLVSSFYKHLKDGKSKSKALQLAKIELMKSGKYDPFYWGAFVLVGDPSPIDLAVPNSAPARVWLLFLAAPLAALILLLLLQTGHQQREFFVHRITPLLERKETTGVGRTAP